MNAASIGRWIITLILSLSLVLAGPVQPAYGWNLFRAIKKITQPVKWIHHQTNRIVKAVKKPVSRFRIGRFKIGKKILCPLIDKQMGRVLPGQVQKILRLRGQADKAQQLEKKVRGFNAFRQKLKAKAAEIRTRALEAEGSVRSIVTDQVKAGTISEAQGVAAIKKAVDVKHALTEAAQHLEIEADRLRLDNMAKRIAGSAFRNSTNVLRQRLLPAAGKAAADAFVNQIEQAVLFTALKQVPADKHDQLKKLINLRGSKVQLAGAPKELADAIERGKFKRLIRIKYGNSKRLPSGPDVSDFIKDLQRGVEREVVRDLKDSLPIDIAKDELKNILVSHAPKQRDKIDELFKKLPDGLEVKRVVKKVKKVIRRIKSLSADEKEEVLRDLIDIMEEAADSDQPRLNIERAVEQILKAAAKAKASRKRRKKRKALEPAQRKQNTSATPAERKHRTVDCGELAKKYEKLAGEASRKASALNCKRSSYSGCAVDVAKPLAARYVFSRKRCQIPGGPECIEGVYKTYMGCIEACNAAWRSSRQRLEPCRQKCYKALESGAKSCEKGG